LEKAWLPQLFTDLLFHFFQKFDVNFVRTFADDSPTPVRMPEFSVFFRAAFPKAKLS